MTSTLRHDHAIRTCKAFNHMKRRSRPRKEGRFQITSNLAVSASCTRQYSGSELQTVGPTEATAREPAVLLGARDRVSWWTMAECRMTAISGHRDAISQFYVADLQRLSCTVYSSANCWNHVCSSWSLTAECRITYNIVLHRCSFLLCIMAH